MRGLSPERAGAAVASPRVDDTSPRIAGDFLGPVSAAAISDDDVRTIRRRDLADHGTNGVRLVERRNDEAQRLHRIPQFWQGAGGASDSSLARKSR